MGWARAIPPYAASFAYYAEAVQGHVGGLELEPRDPLSEGFVGVVDEENRHTALLKHGRGVLKHGRGGGTRHARVGIVLGSVLAFDAVRHDDVPCGDLVGVQNCS